MIDWLNFTPWQSLAGGILVGLATAMLLLLNGKIAGISGIVGGLFSPAAGDAGWRVAFIAGLMVTPLIYSAISTLPAVRIDADTLTLVVAGLLVGFGTRYGSGCTSGHGVCGLSRFSVRSMLATVLFILAGFGAVFFVRHWLG